MAVNKRQHRRNKHKNAKIQKGSLAYDVRYIKRFPAWLMSKLFNYKYVYLITSSAKKNYYKIGIGWNLAIRENQIDKSIQGSKEQVEYAIRVFNSESFENALHQKFKNKNFVFKGSGKTEWFKLTPAEKTKVEGLMTLHETKQQFSMVVLVGFILFIIYLIRQ